MTRTREQFLEERRTGIGGSDIAAVVGLSPWQSPLGVYLDKIGELPPSDETEVMEIGSAVERAILDVGERRIGHRIVSPDEMLRHPEFPYAVVNLDGVVLDHDDERWFGVAEAKNTGEWTDRFKDGVPDYYEIQVQWEMAVSGLPVGWLIALIGGNRIQHWKIERDNTLIARLLDLAGDFWTRVEKRDPPDPDASEATEAALREAFPSGSKESTVTAGAEAWEIVERYHTASSAAKKAEAEKQAAKNQLMTLMGTHGVLEVDGEVAATWTNNKDSESFDREAFEAAHPDLVAKYRKTVPGPRVLRPKKRKVAAS